MILIWLRLPTDPKDPPNPFTCWQVDPTKHMTDMTDFSCWYHMVSCHIMPHHGISWHIMAYHGISWLQVATFMLQSSRWRERRWKNCSVSWRPGDSGRFREIPGDSGRSFFRSWLQLVVVSVILGFVLLYWLTSVGVNIFKWNICETHTFICSIIYYI